MKHAFSLPTLILALSILLSACGTSKQESSNSEQIQAAKEKMITTPPPPLPPGSCRVVATIDAIDRALKGTNENDPCGKAPCMATIKIDSVLGYGSAFPMPLSTGQAMQVKFAHTLNPTKDVWPDIKPALPGLRVKDTFEAFISGSIAMGSSEPVYTIYGYEKK